MTDAHTIEALAKAMSYSLRALNDESEDADEHWLFTSPIGRKKWEQAATAALNVMRGNENAKIAELENALAAASKTIAAMRENCVDLYP
jgi:hypothetical protein